MLLVAPLSGHFATLLRSTVRTMLPEHDVYITDWHNMRDVDLKHGRFGFDEYIELLIHFSAAIGAGAHVVAVCQPCVAVLVATALMAQDNHPAQPRSMTLMASPIDTRVNPTKVNELANSKPIDWFEKNLIARVPFRYDGAFRRVYPGFVQLAAFMSMNIERHVKAHRELYDNLSKGELDKAKATKDFYDEYFAVLDLSADFISKPCARCSRSTACRRASCSGAASWSSRAPSNAPCCSPSRARRTTSVRSARLSPPTTCARAFARTASAITCRPASATTACSQASAGRIRFIRC